MTHRSRPEEPGEVLCTADKDGLGCGAPLRRAGTSEEHLDHTSDCRWRHCSSCGTTTGMHYPHCTSPWEEAA
jgi:hypothetical protein